MCLRSCFQICPGLVKELEAGDAITRSAVVAVIVLEQMKQRRPPFTRIIIERIWRHSLGKKSAERRNIPFMIFHGTLLGAMREKVLNSEGPVLLGVIREKVLNSKGDAGAGTELSRCDAGPATKKQVVVGTARNKLTCPLILNSKET